VGEAGEQLGLHDRDVTGSSNLTGMLSLHGDFG
jgi:hypothetical protein